MTDHYKILGVPRDADIDTIKRAYREKASKAHPDREGGSPEMMAAINLAYETLSDPDKRKRYDRTGYDGPEKDFNSLAEQALMQLIDGYLNEEREFRGNLIERFRGTVQNSNENLRAAKEKLEQRMKKLERDRVRLKGPPIIGHMVDEKIRLLHNGSERADEQIKVNGLVLDLLKQCEDLGLKDPTDTMVALAAVQGFQYKRTPHGPWNVIGNDGE